MTAPMQPHLTAIVLTYNESRHIQACLDTLAFADAILVFDSFSTDDTVTLAQQAGAETIQHAFDNYAAQRNAALEAVQNRTDWVLFVDADERVPPELATEVRAKIAAEVRAKIAAEVRAKIAAAHDDAPVAYRIPRFNYLFGRLTKGAGWYPDYQTRLLKTGAAHFDPQIKVHEVVVMQGNQGTLAEHFIHYNYDHIQQFIAKQRKYVRYDATIMHEQGIRPKPQNYILQPLRHFRWRFFTLKGYQEGWHGLRLSTIMAWYEFRKYWILRQLWR